jgi:hypothetical protein
MSLANEPKTTIPTESEFSKNIKLLSATLPREDMQLFIYQQMERFLQQHKHKKVEEKCTEFLLLKTSILYQLGNKIPDLTSRLLAALVNYIDITIATLFFKQINGKSALHERFDKDFYFAFLNFVIYRVEFPSLIVEELKDSLQETSRKSVPLSRRNYLIAVMQCAYRVDIDFYKHFTPVTGVLPKISDFKNHFKINRKNLAKFTYSTFALHEKILERQKKGGIYKLYRGYEISGDQDVIVDRKIRIQFANKSVSFTTSRDLALSFAKTRFNHRPVTNVLSVADRFNVLKTMLDDVDQYAVATNRKCIFAEYEFDENDLVCAGSHLENEVIAIPDTAKLTRYSIVYAS